MDIHGNYEGGGECQECQRFTRGINCEQCIDGFFRPPGVPANSTEPCRRKSLKIKCSLCYYGVSQKSALRVNSQKRFSKRITLYFQNYCTYQGVEKMCYIVYIFYFSACDCPDDRHSGNCRPSDGLCECKEAFRGAEDCSACAEVGMSD